MPNDWTEGDLRAQMRRIKGNGLFDLCRTSAKAHVVYLPWLLALWSRETRIVNCVGDNGHGHGPGQVDDRSHPIPETLAELCDASAAIAYQCYDWARTNYPSFTPNQILKVAADDYNAGERGVRRGVAEGNADNHTTGHDYGADVLRRMAVFEALLNGK